MSDPHHHEDHFTATEVVRDVIIGMSDGLTVPFALAAGLTGALASNSIIVTAGIAEIAAGSIAMGLGGYLAGKNDAEHYAMERKREYREVEEIPEMEKKEIREIFESYNIPSSDSEKVVEALSKDKDKWVDFMMKFELGLEEPDPKRAVYSAITIAGSYIVGGFVPLASYIMMTDTHNSLIASAIITSFALLLFGYFKGRLTSTGALKGAIRTLLIGGLAATAAYTLAKMLG